MQRLLRGRALYIVLAALLLGLYSYVIITGQGKIPDQHEIHAHFENEPRQSLELLPKPIDAATIQQLAKDKPAIALIASVATIAMTGIVIAGLCLSIFGLFSGKIKSLWQIPVAQIPGWSMKETVRILLLVLLIAGLMPFGRLALLSVNPHWELDMRLWMPVSMFVLDTFIILVILAFGEGKRYSSAWKAVGFTPGLNRSSCRLAMRAYTLALPWLLLLLFLIVALANRFNWEPPAEPIQELIFSEGRPWVFMITALLACVIGPLAEELFFRGVLYSALRKKTSRWLAMLISGALFGMIHTNLIGLVPIMLLGLLLAYIYERSGSVAAVLIHITHNSLLMGMALVYRHITPAS